MQWVNTIEKEWPARIGKLFEVVSSFSEYTGYIWNVQIIQSSQDVHHIGRTEPHREIRLDTNQHRVNQDQTSPGGFAGFWGGRDPAFSSWYTINKFFISQLVLGSFHRCSGKASIGFLPVVMNTYEKTYPKSLGGKC